MWLLPASKRSINTLFFLELRQSRCFQLAKPSRFLSCNMSFFFLLFFFFFSRAKETQVCTHWRIRFQFLRLYSQLAALEPANAHRSQVCFSLGFREQGEGIALVDLKLKALCSLTKCFIVIRLIRFLLSSSRCYHRLEAAVGNQSGRAQTLSRWDQLTVIWFQNTLPEEALGRARPPRYETGAGVLCSCSIQPSWAASPPTCPSPTLPQISSDFRWCWCSCCLEKKFSLSLISESFFLVPTGLSCQIH